MQKLVIITPWYNCFSGGAEVLARKLAEESVIRGLDVEVLTTLTKSPYDSWWKDSNQPEREIINGVVVKRFPVNKYGQNKYEAAVSKQVNGQVLSSDDKEDFFAFGISSDRLITHVSKLKENTHIFMLPYFQSLAYNLITKNPNKISFIPCFHNESQFYWEQTKRMIQNCKNIFFLSQPEKEMVIHQYGSSFGKKVIEAKVVGAGVKPTEGEKFVHGLPEKYVLYVGRKDAAKGVRELVNYHKALQQKNIPLVFIGGGDNTLVPKSDQFIDLGFVEEEEKNFIIKHASCLINLSPNESFSFVIMEAWLKEVPVIVNSNCNVTRYHVEESQGGFAISNLDDYQQAMDHIMNNRKNAELLGKNGKIYVTNNYNWDNVIENLVATEICK